MAGQYDVALRSLSHYGHYSFQNGQFLDPSSTGTQIGTKTIPIALLQRALSFLDPGSWTSIPFINKAWYQAAKGKLFLLHFSQEEKVKGKQDSYTIKRNLSRADAQSIFEQAGIEIGFAPGQAQIDNFSLGRGAFGEFCIARAAKKANFVGIKITRGKDASEREAQIQLALHGLPSIMPTLDLCKTVDATGSPALYQVMELGGLGSTARLKPFLDRLIDQRFKEQVLFCLAEGLLMGLAQMHEKGYYHLDMKPDNLVVRQDGQVFLIDFGCSQRSTKPVIDTRQTNGDWCFFSPERAAVASALCDAAKIDAWAAGMTLLLLGGYVSMQKVITFDDADKARKSLTMQAASFKPLSRSSFLAFLKSLLDPNPNERITPAEALRHTWFLQMQKASTEWRADTVAYLRELVQSLHRETRTVRGALSPQDLPLPHFAAYIERTELQDALQKLLFSPVSYEKSAITVCQGMGGVGKTQFVTHLIHQRAVRLHFGLKLWFRSSDSRSLLETQTTVLARELGLVDDKTPFEQAQQRLHYFLANCKKPWLIVFDNAEDAKMLTPFLPASGGHILITTRSTSWVGAISIDLFTPEEGEALVHKLLQRPDPLSRDLCKELGYLPLGIVQACAFIRNQNLPLSAYLEQLRKDAAIVEKDERLFGKKLPNSMLSLWQTTFQAIQSTHPKALELLDVLTYLAPEGIPPRLMQKLDTVAARDILKQYALLREDAHSSYAIHRLVQLAVRSKQDPERQTPALVKGMKALNELYAFLPTTQEMQNNQQLMVHGESISAHAEPLTTTLPALFEPFARTLRWLGNQHGVLGHFNTQKDLQETALQIFQKVHGEQHPNVATSLSDLGIAWKALGDARKAIQYQEQALAIYKKVHGDQHPDVATSLNNLGKAWNALGDAQKAIQYQKLALAIYKKVHGEQHPDVAAALNNLGRAWNTLGDARKAIQYHEQALAIRKKVYGDQHPDVATSLSNLGNVWNALGNAQKAIQYQEQALAIRKKVHGEQHPDVATSRNNLGVAWNALGDARKAIQYHEQALAIRKKVYGDQHPDVATSLNNLGHAWDALGDARKAIQYHEQALAIRKKVYGDQHPDVAISLNNLGSAWNALGDAQKAIQYHEQALAIRKKVYGEHHPSVATSLNNLGSAWNALGDGQKAIQCHEQALAIYKKVYGDQHPDVATSLNHLGIAWNALGDARKAIEYHEQALDIDKKVYGEKHPSVATSLSHLGLACKALGDARKAIQYQEQALAIYKKVHGEHHPSVATLLNNLGIAWNALGDARKAIQYHEQALAIYKKVYGEQHPDVAIALNSLGSAWNALGDARKVIQYLEQALAIRKKVYGEHHPSVAICLNNLGAAWQKIGDKQKARQYFNEAYQLAMSLPALGPNHPSTKTYKAWLDLTR